MRRSRGVRPSQGPGSGRRCRPSHEAAQDLLGLVLTQIKGQRLFRAVEPDEVARHAHDRFVVTPGEVPHARALDLYNSRAEIRKLAGGEGGCDRLLQGDDGYPF